MPDFMFSGEIIALAITGVVGFGIWLLRLEGRVSAIDSAKGLEIKAAYARLELVEKSQEKLWERVNNLDSEIMKELRRQGESLARIEGKLGMKAEGGRS